MLFKKLVSPLLECHLNIGFNEAVLFCIADSQWRFWARAVTKYQLRGQAGDVKVLFQN